MALSDGYELMVARRSACEAFRALCPGYDDPTDPGVPPPGMSAEQAAAFIRFYDADLAWDVYRAKTGDVVASIDIRDGFTGSF